MPPWDDLPAESRRADWPAGLARRRPWRSDSHCWTVVRLRMYTSSACEGASASAGARQPGLFAGTAAGCAFGRGGGWSAGVVCARGRADAWA